MRPSQIAAMAVGTSVNGAVELTCEILTEKGTALPGAATAMRRQNPPADPPEHGRRQGQKKAAIAGGRLEVFA
jgi:hypothetical protein